MTVATVARALQRPWSFVWPLIFGKRTLRAKEFALEVANSGELRIEMLYHRVGFVGLLVFSPAHNKKWWVHIRPVHFGGLTAKVFDFSTLRYVEFGYCTQGVTERHKNDPSTYLTIKSVR